jgi:hypothetical protein
MGEVSFTLIALLALQTVGATVYDYVVDFGAIPSDDSQDTCWNNGQALNASLATLQPGDTLTITSGETFHLMGGIIGDSLKNVTIEFEGSLIFSGDWKSWPKTSGSTLRGEMIPCLYFTNCEDVVFTSSEPYVPPMQGEDYELPTPPASGTGLLDGVGQQWWGLPLIGYAVHGEKRPKLFKLDDCINILVENLYFKDSPYWTFSANRALNLEIRYSTISARRDEELRHGVYDLSAFNTDGFDVTGQYVHIHDVQVWNQDDCICAKDGSKDMLFERITASGLGLTVGSISSNDNSNLTFRDVFMPETYKGIYVKFRGPGVISDLVFENIQMLRPEQWPIWLGPAQQSDSARLCAAHPCSICWPEVPAAECNMPEETYLSNVLLKNVTVIDPANSPGVIIGNSSTPLMNITFQDVVVENPPVDGYFGTGYYDCENVENGVATGSTWPVPPCFEDQTDASSPP